MEVELSTFFVAGVRSVESPALVGLIRVEPHSQGISTGRDHLWWTSGSAETPWEHPTISVIQSVIS